MNTGVCLDVLRQANASLASFFERFSGMPVTGSKREIEALSQVEQVLHSVGNLLKQGIQGSEDTQVKEELFKYGAYLLRLRLELAAMQNLAVECRARLRVRQKHLNTAQAWCEASQATQ
jgi:hypothetical protein